MKYQNLSLIPLLVTGVAFSQLPPQIKNLVVIFQENRTPDTMKDQPSHEPACPVLPDRKKHRPRHAMLNGIRPKAN